MQYNNISSSDSIYFLDSYAERKDYQPLHNLYYDSRLTKTQIVVINPQTESNIVDFMELSIYLTRSSQAKSNRTKDFAAHTVEQLFLHNMLAELTEDYSTNETTLAVPAILANQIGVQTILRNSAEPKSAPTQAITRLLSNDELANLLTNARGIATSVDTVLARKEPLPKLLENSDKKSEGESTETPRSPNSTMSRKTPIASGRRSTKARRKNARSTTQAAAQEEYRQERVRRDRMSKSKAIAKLIRAENNKQDNLNRDVAKQEIQSEA